MENRKHVILFIFIPALVAGFFISVKNANAYHSDTHSYLTQEAVRFYNQNYADKFPEALTDYLVDGARREDDAPRWGNHFYDPVYERGLTYDASVNPLSIGNWESSKNWAQDSGNQNGLLYKVVPTVASILTAAQTGNLGAITTETDFTWKKAIEYYTKGEWEKAMFALGHVIHLIEDASVPAHTRNDPHANGDSYEDWTSKFTLGAPDEDLKARLGGISPIGLDNLDSYFNGIATYSNNNFYSDRTIGVQSGYGEPTPDYLESCNDYMCGIGSDGGVEYNLFLKEASSDYNVVKTYSSNISLLIKKIGGDVVMSNYWSRLSTKAVQYSAGVIGLFINAAKAATKEAKIQPPQETLVGSIVTTVSNAAASVREATLSAAGTLVDMILQNHKSVGSAVTVPDRSQEEITNDVQAPENLNIETFKNVNAPPPPNVAVMSEIEKQAKLAEIAAQLDDIGKQVQAIQAAQDTAQLADEERAPKDTNKGETTTQQATSTAVSTTTPAQQNQSVNHVSYVSGGSGGGGGGTTVNQPVVYPKLLITEVQITSASSTHEEFVEIYNPNDTAVSLTDWYAQRKTSSSSSFGTFAPKSLLEGKTITSHGYLLIAHPSSTFAADVFTTHPLTAGNTLALKDPNGDVKDKVGWGNANDCDGGCAPEPAGGESIQRIYAYGVFQDADQNSADFAILACPSPKSSAVCEAVPASESTSTATSTATSTEEAASTTSSTLPVIATATAVFSTSSLAIDLRWSEASNASGTTSTVHYIVKDASSSAILASTTATSATIGIIEVGRVYHLSIQALSNDEMISEPVSVSVDVPSLFSDLRLYQDPRVTSSVQYVLDAYYDHYPLVMGGDNGFWDGAVFYFDSDPVGEEYIPTYFDAAASSALTLLYPQCGYGIGPARKILILPDRASACDTVGGDLYHLAFSGALEDNHFIVPIDESSVQDFTSDDYITVAFYDYHVGYNQGFHLAAADQEKYYFQPDTPTSTRPNPPSDISFDFESFHSILSAGWPSAVDSDTPDGSLRYEFNYTTSTVLMDNLWLPTASVGTWRQVSLPVIFGNKYKIGVRAIDDFGNVSDVMERDWNFPAGYVPLPHQGDHGSNIGLIAGQSQKFLMSRDAAIDQVAMWVGNSHNSTSYAASYLVIAADNHGTPGTILATSSLIINSGCSSCDQGENIYAFADPVDLFAGREYWLAPIDGPSPYNTNVVYGSAGNSYVDGYWSGDSNKDAYFYLHAVD